MSLSNILKNELEITSELDEDALEYLDSLLQESTDVNDIRTLIEQVADVQVSDSQFDAICRRFKKELYPDIAFECHDDNKELDLLTEEDHARLLSMEAATGEAPPSPPLQDSPTKSTKNSKQTRKDSQKQKKADTSPKTKPNPPELSSAAQDVERLKREGKFLTRRFERFHKTWAGNDLWKVQPHRLAEQIEELDDDDYSTAWLECLRLGIPWGNRGAGGRGVQKVTGYVKDVHIPNVTMCKGVNRLLDYSILRLTHGKRYALVGRNGCGKSTLLRRISLGSLPGFPPWLQVQHVEQELPVTELTPAGYVLLFNHERTRLLNEEAEILEFLEVAQASHDDLLEKQKRLTDIYSTLEMIGAYEFEDKVDSALRAIGFSDALLAKPMSELSGGWRMRATLCGALVMEPDILIMDEPTNHLDADGVQWLEKFIKTEMKFDGTLLVVSHDQSFLNSVTNETIIFRNQQLTYFSGNYHEYREMLDQKRVMQAHKLEVQEKRKKELEDYITTQQQAAKDRKSKGGDQKKQKQIRSRKKKIEKIDVLGFGGANGEYVRTAVVGGGVPSALDVDEKPLVFKFPSCTQGRGGDIIAQLENVAYGYNSVPLIENVTAQVTTKARIGILGKNGSGKSTLMKVFMNYLNPIAGSLTVSPTLKMVLFEQDMITKLDIHKTPLELVMERSASTKASGFLNFENLETEDDARQYLGSFGLAGALALQKIETLSGGQKSRVVFALVSITHPDLYILDEPSNHLDIESIEVLSSAIKSFNGAMIVISHDRYLLQSTVSEIWMLHPKTKSMSIHQQGPDDTQEEFFNPVYQNFISSCYGQ